MGAQFYVSRDPGGEREDRYGDDDMTTAIRCVLAIHRDQESQPRWLVPSAAGDGKGRLGWLANTKRSGSRQQNFRRKRLAGPRIAPGGPFATGVVGDEMGKVRIALNEEYKQPKKKKGGWNDLPARSC